LTLSKVGFFVTFESVADSAPKKSFYAGDSSTWTSSFADYSAAESWVATCVFQRPGASAYRIEGVASGTDFVFTISPSDSSALESGRWLWGIRVAKDATTKTVATGTTVVLPNPEAIPVETHNEKCLRLLKAAMEERAVDVQESISILGQDVTKIASMELEQLIDNYQAKVNRERKHAYRLFSGDRTRRGRIYLVD